MELESKKIVVGKSQGALFEQLAQVRNFERLMPDNLVKFEMIRDDAFVFALKGMPEITLEKKSEVPATQLVLGAPEGKLPFMLTTNLDALSEESTEVKMHFNGDFNPLIAMMVKTPLGKLIETIVSKMQEL